MKMPFFYAKDQGEEEKLSASHNIKNGQNYGSTFFHSYLNEKDVENEMGSCIYITQCLKITKNVSFNIASEASYVCILRGQKFIKMPKMVHFGESLKI